MVAKTITFAPSDIPESINYQKLTNGLDETLTEDDDRTGDKNIQQGMLY
jgi:hypothetical protein